MLGHRELTIATLLRVFPWRILLTTLLTLAETALMALIPLFIGFAIDGLLADSVLELLHLAILFALVVGLAVSRRIYDTRVYSALRVELGKTQVDRASNLPISTLNAQVAMGRELIEFLEETLPMVLAGATQMLIAVIILFAFSPLLAVSAGLSALGASLIYALFHRRFFRLNADLNEQNERQVAVFTQRKPRSVAAHFLRLRRAEVRISDSEALLYGLIFLLLLTLILFNIWHATTALAVTTGAIFSIVSYSWDFVDGAVTLPATLQNWTRLSEIMSRINTTHDGAQT